MNSGDGRGWPAFRLLSAVLFVVLGITGVHGAGSPAVPAGAILTEHASVGAALVQPTPSAGREEELLIRSAHQAEETEEPQLTVELPAALAAPVTDPVPATISTAPVPGRQQPPARGGGVFHQGRAPPA